MYTAVSIGYLTCSDEWVPPQRVLHGRKGTFGVSIHEKVMIIMLGDDLEGDGDHVGMCD